MKNFTKKTALFLVFAYACANSSNAADSKDKPTYWISDTTSQQLGDKKYWPGDTSFQLPDWLKKEPGCHIRSAAYQQAYENALSAGLPEDEACEIAAQASLDIAQHRAFIKKAAQDPHAMKDAAKKWAAEHAAEPLE